MSNQLAAGEAHLSHLHIMLPIFAETVSTLVPQNILFSKIGN